MPDSAPSLRSLFPELEARAHEPPPDRWQKFRARLDEEIKGIKWPATMPDLLPQIGELLDVKVPDILISAWKKARELQDALDRSRQSSEETIKLELAEHTLASEHHPYIEIRVGRLIPAKHSFCASRTAPSSRSKRVSVKPKARWNSPASRSRRRSSGRSNCLG
jgi:hypothetical protein